LERLFVVKDVRKKDILFRTTGLFGTPGIARTVGIYDVLADGTVRWAVHSVDGGSAPLVDYRLDFALFEGAVSDVKGTIVLADGSAVMLRGKERAVELLQAILAASE
jgi:hypothetical protein